MKIAFVHKPDRLTGLLSKAAEWHLRQHAPGVTFWDMHDQIGQAADLSPYDPDVVIAHIRSPAMVARMQALTCPVINTSGILPDLPFPTVSPDNFKIGQLAAEYLASRGAEHFAYIGIQNLSYVEQRWQGFAYALPQAPTRVRVPGIHITSTPDIDLKIAPETTEWLKQAQPNTAVLCSEDRLAVQLIAFIRKTQPTLLNQIGIMSAHDYGTPCIPALTAIHISEQAWGAAAAKLALQIATDPSFTPPIHVHIPPRGVYERESTAALTQGTAEVAAALKFIRLHATQPLSVQTVSDAVNVSRRKLERAFRNQLDHTVLDAIHTAHLDKAKLLLIETSHTMSTIATLAGFASEQQLRRVFQNYLQTTPGIFRKEHTHTP